MHQKSFSAGALSRTLLEEIYYNAQTPLSAGRGQFLPLPFSIHAVASVSRSRRHAPRLILRPHPNKIPGYAYVQFLNVGIGLHYVAVNIQRFVNGIAAMCASRVIEDESLYQWMLSLGFFPPEL